MTLESSDESILFLSFDGLAGGFFFLEDTQAIEEEIQPTNVAGISSITH
jgi:hypothetical protein